jgi:putative ABC transport system permease protein
MQEQMARANEVRMVALGVCMIALTVLLHLFFRTRAGLALRASGTSGRALAALSAPVNVLIIAGIMLSNALVALSGALFAHELRAATVTSGLGMLVFGLGSVIIAEGLFGKRSFIRLVYGTMIGAVFFRLISGFVLQVNANDANFKLFTALVVLVALILPKFWQRIRHAGAARGGGF